MKPDDVFEPGRASPDERPRDARTESLKSEYTGRERLLPREKLLRCGAAALTDAELLAIQLRSGTQGRNVLAVAEDLLRSYGDSMALLSQAGVEELCGQLGVGEVRGITLAAVFEIARRILSESVEDRPVLDSPSAVARYLRPFIVQNPTEGFYVLPLDRRCRLCGPVMRHRISSGTADSTPVHPREVFIEAIRSRATFVMIAHNHPSGNVEPSAADLRLTRDLIAAGKLLSIPVVDHVIVGDIASRKTADGKSGAENCLDAVPKHTSLRDSGKVDFV